MKEIHREILFPRASPSVVWGVAPALSTEGETDIDEPMETDSDVSAETEKSLLQEAEGTGGDELTQVVVHPGPQSFEDSIRAPSHRVSSPTEGMGYIAPTAGSLPVGPSKGMPASSDPIGVGTVSIADLTAGIEAAKAAGLTTVSSAGFLEFLPASVRPSSTGFRPSLTETVRPSLTETIRPSSVATTSDGLPAVSANTFRPSQAVSLPSTSAASLPAAPVYGFPSGPATVSPAGHPSMPPPAAPVIPVTGTPASAALGASSTMTPDFSAMFHTMQQMQSQLLSLQEEIKRERSTPSTSYECPLYSDLPKDHPELPWSHGLSVRLADGLYLLDKEKPRPISELQFCGDSNRFPHCWVRVAPWAPPRVDSVPKETVLFPYQKAQDRIVELVQKSGFTQTQLTLITSNKAMFQASGDRIFPFASKVFSSVEKALLEEKPCPTLEEHKRTSMLLPNDSEAWKCVGETFSVGKLAPEVGAKQLQENLPYLFDTIIKEEYEARMRLSNSLSFQTLLETCIDSVTVDPRENIFSCLAKQHSGVLKDDLYAFGMARRACRKHVLRNAKVRHEPSKLIDASIWGKDLFPEDVVSEVRAQAMRESKTLIEKWDATVKRQQQGQGGRFSKKRKSRPAKKYPQRQQQQQQQQQQHQQQQQNPQPQGTSQQQSPAFVSKREEKKSSYNPRRGKGKQPFRGGRGGKGKGKNTGSSQSQR